MNKKLWDPPNLYNWEAPLIQERYFPDRWKMLVCCILLNLTSIKQVRPMIDDLFELVPDPYAMATVMASACREFHINHQKHDKKW